MKKIIKIAKFVCAIVLLTNAIACSKNDEEHHHEINEEWTRAEFTFRRGHLHGENFHGNPENALFPSQKYVFEKDASGKIIRKDSKGNILTEEKDPIIMIEGWQYALEIVYYNEKGERINGHFAEAKHLPYHQHFFTIENYVETKTGTTKPYSADFWDYTYRDTNPENVQKDLPADPKDIRKGRSQLTGDPLGLKGYFSPKVAYVKFDVRVRLLHITKGSKYKNNDKTQGGFPFDAPSEDLLSRSSADFDAKFPIHIITKPSSGDIGEYERYIKDLADFYKKSEAEIKELLNKANNEAENSAYWM